MKIFVDKNQVSESLLRVIIGNPLQTLKYNLIKQKLANGSIISKESILQEEIIASAFGVVPEFINEDYIKAKNTNFAKVINQYNVLTNTLANVMTEESGTEIVG